MRILDDEERRAVGPSCSQCDEGSIEQFGPCGVRERTEQFGEREIRNTYLTEVQAPPDQYPSSARFRIASQFCQQPRFADTGVTGHDGRGRYASGSVGDDLFERREFGVPSDQSASHANKLRRARGRRSFCARLRTRRSYARSESATRRS